MKESVLMILGNGFDLDLGLKTSYKDFVESKLLHQRDKCALFDRICKQYETKLWIDVEEELKGMATEKFVESQDTGENEVYPNLLEQYELLVQELTEYIKGIDYEAIKKESAAAKVIKSVLRFSQNPTLIDFNYTDIDAISRKIDWPKNIPCKHIHGEAMSNSIIVGFDDDVNLLRDKYCQIIKSHSEHFRSVNINEALEAATEVIFFGHSLGSTDYHYFSDFFLSQVKEIGEEKFSKKTIKIFTYDEAARQNILLQLRKMNNKKTTLLYDLNDFQIYRTAPEYNKDHQAINEYCDKLRKRAERRGNTYTVLRSMV